MQLIISSTTVTGFQWNFLFNSQEEDFLSSYVLHTNNTQNHNCSDECC